MAIYLREGSSDPLHVWFYSGVFGVGGSNGAISGFAKSKMATRPPSWKIQMAISPRRIVQFTPCLVLDGVFGIGGSNGNISGFAKSKMAARFIIDCGCSFKLWKVKSLSLHVQCLLTSLIRVGPRGDVVRASCRLASGPFMKIVKAATSRKPIYDRNILVG